MHCTSGLAYMSAANTATCISTKNITQNGVLLPSPYACSPLDNAAPCRITYNTGASDYIEVMCDCALDQQKGYCSRIPGTPEYKNMTAHRKRGYVDSVCHTLDRDDYLALKDSCGNMKDHITWYNMYLSDFTHKYWAHMQNETISTCFQNFVAYSPINYKAAATFYGSVLSAILTAYAIVSLIY